MSLSLNNLCIGNVIIRIDSCDSTNLFAKKLLSKSEPIEGTVILTDKQSNGKGQIGNSWESEPYKNLTFSVVVFPSFLKTELQFYLSKIVSLACIYTFEHFTNERFLIKWPNDIFFKDKKFAGILIENSILKSKITNSILGIGLNINQEIFKNSPKANSLKNLIQRETDVDVFLNVFLKKLDKYYLDLRKNKLENIDLLYEKNLMGVHIPRVFNERGILFEGIIRGVNDQGQILIEKEDNKLHFFNFKEITWHF